MFDIELGKHTDCDGITRRDLLPPGEVPPAPRVGFQKVADPRPVDGLDGPSADRDPVHRGTPRHTFTAEPATVGRRDGA